MEVVKYTKMNDLLTPDSPKKNFVFQFLYQITILVIPLVVSPYLTRTLGATSLGVYSYTYSIAYYFVTFAMLGINRYGQRVISQRRGNLVKLRKTFWSLLTVHFIASILAIVAYVIYVMFICRSDFQVALVQTIYVASAAFDSTWLFYGLEKFKSVALRNAAIRLINTVCIFAFIHSPSDIVIYTFIMTITVLIGYVIFIPQVMVVLPPIKFSTTDIREHIKPLFTLFAAVVAVSLYTVFDKTLLGILATKESVAYYEYSDKIVNISKSFITIVSTVLYPKACQYASNNNLIGMKNNMKKSLAVSCFWGFASCFGLLAIADQFSLLYYGEEFAVCSDVIKMMTPLILILGIGETVRSQFIYPLKMDMAMVKILSLNAVINLIISALLIPYLGISGAVIGSIAAELNGLVIEIYIVREYISPKSIITVCIPYLSIASLMYFVIKPLKILFGVGWTSLLIQVVIGGIIYCVSFMVYALLFNRPLLDDVKDIVKKLVSKIKR